MRGVVFNGERELELMRFPDPTPDPHDVVIEMKASGMCGSDLHQYRRPKGGAQASGIPMREGPVIAGHEPCASWWRSVPRSTRARRASASA
jgi:threonine dehydrogenase-like Zn-dependent dehydrogenase